MGKQSRAKRSKRSQQINTKPQTAPPTGGLKRIWRLLSLLSPTNKFWVGFGLLLTIVGTIYAFSPNLSIDIGDSINPNDPFATQFILKNDGFLWINMVDPYKCTLNNVLYDGGPTFNRPKFIFVIPPIPFLESREQTTFVIPFKKPFIILPESAKVVFADIEIIISYYPALFPSLNFLKKEYKARFITTKNIDGTLHWTRIAKSIKATP